MKRADVIEISLMTLLTVLCIAGFPINPLVLAGLLELGFYLPMFILAILPLSERQKFQQLLKNTRNFSLLV